MNDCGISLQSSIWLVAGGKSLAGRGRIELLERIAEAGSIRQAAIAMSMSYRAAWDAVDAMNQRAPEPVVSRSTGGRGGGGATLTGFGERLVAVFRTMESEQVQHLKAMDRRLDELFSK